MRAVWTWAAALLLLVGLLLWIDAVLAYGEGLQAHARAAELRLGEKT